MNRIQSFFFGLALGMLVTVTLLGFAWKGRTSKAGEQPANPGTRIERTAPGQDRGSRQNLVA
jgi:hypothetical protein